MKKLVIAVCALIVVFLGVFVFTVFRDAGEFKDLKPHADCRCVKVPNVHGSEDIATDHITGMTYISSSDFRAQMKGEFRQGAICTYSLEGEPVLRNLTAGLKRSLLGGSISQCGYPHFLSVSIGQ